MKQGFFGLILSCVCMCFLSANAQTEDINYGTDEGEYAFDNICDDPRFTGLGVTSDLDWGSVGLDATDCRNAVNAQAARYWFDPRALSLVKCDAVEFGDDTSGSANNNACDDPRFLSFTSIGINLVEDLMKDATDCKWACELELLYERPEK